MSESARRPIVEIGEVGDFELEADVVVVGSGAAALAAAISALRRGPKRSCLRSRRLSAAPRASPPPSPGTPNHRGLQVDGYVDEKDDALRYMARLARPDAYDPADPKLGLEPWRYELLESFYDNAADAAESLHSSPGRKHPSHRDARLLRGAAGEQDASRAQPAAPDA